MSEFGSELISVVIPNYNGSDYLRVCLDSVLAGSLVPKVIVIDNGSSDCSCEMIEKSLKIAGNENVHRSCFFV